MKKEIGLFGSLHELFPTTFFAGGTPPTSNFVEAFQARLKEVTSRSNSVKTQLGRSKARGASDIHSIMASWVNAMFQMKSNLLLYREADWNPDKIPDNALTFRSTLTSLRLAQTPVKLDANGKQSLERTELVQKVLKDGLTEDFILHLRATLIRVNEKEDAQNVEYLAMSKEMLPGFDHDGPARVCEDEHLAVPHG